MEKRSGATNQYSPELKDLLNCMLQVDPIHRPSIQEVMAHPWFNGPVYTQQEIIQEFQVRHAKVREELEAQKKEKELQKEKTY